MAKMSVDEIVGLVRCEMFLKEDDYFDASVFYYLSGRFPDLTISQCVDVVNCLRQSTGQI